MQRPPAAAVPLSPSDGGPVEASRRNRLAGLALDRCDERRGDPDWLSAGWARGRLLVLDRDGRAACRSDRLALAAVDCATVDPHCLAQASFLGCRGEQPWWAIDAERLADDACAGLNHWLGLREAAAGWDAFDSGLFSYAKALLFWQQRAGFCGACGSPTQPARGGHVRRCSNLSCALEHYPRTDAAIIVLVTDGERALIGRQAGWPAGRYSTLAGFVEPGESLEDAVRREIAEEAGVQVGDCRYHSSQPWPFPASLMIGFRADASSREIRTSDEIEHAMWIDAAALLAAVAERRLGMPSRISVSYRLLADWLIEQLGPGRVREVLPDA